MEQHDHREELLKAAKAIKNATALLLTSGAGLGVDSGLPDFRGPQGFWRAYPPMEKLGLKFENMSTPMWFDSDPHFAWGFWAHRYHLYTDATPHEGYQIMRRWGEQMPDGYFVFTSNVDGHWRKSGVPNDHLYECHGTIDFLQCFKSCTNEVWATTETIKENLVVDTSSFKTTSPLPKCKHCDKIARPNVLMFNDWGFLPTREEKQELEYKKFKKNVKKSGNLVVVEVGAGKAVPTVRYTSEDSGGQIIRINLRDGDVPNRKQGEQHISIPMGGLQALKEIDKLMKTL